VPGGSFSCNQNGAQGCLYDSCADVLGLPKDSYVATMLMPQGFLCNSSNSNCNFDSVYILVNTSLGTTNKIIWHNHKQGQARIVFGAWNHHKFMSENQFQMKAGHGISICNCNNSPNVLGLPKASRVTNNNVPGLPKASSITTVSIFCPGLLV